MLSLLLHDASALASVAIIDIVLAGDNAVVVGLAASGLAPEQRRRVIMLGITVATALRILFAFVAVRLLETVIGITLAGGLLLLWVAWKMYREISTARPVAAAAGDDAPRRSGKTQAQAFWRIIAADLSMSLDNVLAVAGAARDHPYVLALGLAFSVALMGVASNYVARLLDRMFWLSWLGLGVVAFVALRLIFEGSVQVMRQTALIGLGFG